MAAPKAKSQDSSKTGEASGTFVVKREELTARDKQICEIPPLPGEGWEEIDFQTIRKPFS